MNRQLNYAQRVSRLQEDVKRREADALVVTDPANRFYLSGFGPTDPASAESSGVLLAGADQCVFITNNLYFEAAKNQIEHLDVVLAPVRTGETLTDLLADWSVKTAGYESTHLTVSQLDRWRKDTPKTKFIPLDGVIEEYREVKDESEIARISAAVDLTDQAFEYVKGILRPGLAEKEIAWQIERYLREHGAEGVAFAPAVASGPNSAVPHHEPGERTIAAGEPIWLDFGARVDHYCADLTRTVCLGKPPKQMVEIVGLVGQALATAEAQVKAGQTGKNADSVARDLLADAGYGDAFIHSLGHGLGLEIHEAPRLSRFFENKLNTGAAVTIEPGIYLPGWGGVRIEDTVTIVGDGVEVLTGASKDWIIT